jgi:cell division protein ZapA (FtsZ GTPase activity inhibitor)
VAEKPSLIRVEIFGQTYSVKAGADPSYVEKLAAYVDEQMKEVSRSTGAVDSVRIAVLGALNLADECFRLRRELEESQTRSTSADHSHDERVKRLARTLDTALGD